MTKVHFHTGQNSTRNSNVSFIELQETFEYTLFLGKNQGHEIHVLVDVRTTLHKLQYTIKWPFKILELNIPLNEAKSYG